MKTKVYHGTIETVENPICAFGRKNLDFGQGFYVTDIREQAVKWAVLIAQKRKEHPVINRYLFLSSTYKCNFLGADNKQ